MGFVGITEGAIPFTLVKASRLVPLNMLGCALGAAVTCLLGAKATIPPVGGIYGFITIGSGWAYLVGMLVGALFIAFVILLRRRLWQRKFILFHIFIGTVNGISQHHVQKYI